MDSQVVGVRTALDQAHHLVDCWIDDLVDVAGVVALQDAHRDAVVAGIEQYAEFFIASKPLTVL